MNELILNDYFEQKMSAKKIATKYGYKTSKSILDIIKKAGLHPRSHQVSRDIKKSYLNFDIKTIDSLEKAYFIGLMLTDGYVQKNNNQIGIDLIDKDCIEFLSNYINCKITTIDPMKQNQKYIAKRNLKYRIIIYSDKLKKQLSRFGIVPQKTFILGDLNLKSQEIKFLPVILRGIIDGDGWIRKDGKEFFICSASENFIKWCIESLEKLNMKSLKITKDIREDRNILYYVRSATKNNIEILKNKIYNKNFGMSRKYNLLNTEKPSETIM